MNKKKAHILDCTLRDGGYYNQWNFKKELVQKYLDSIQNSKIQLVEIGFRFLSNANLFGPFAYSKENFLKKLNLPSNIKYLIMLNASDFDNLKFKNQIQKLFGKHKSKYISIVRIAIKENEIDKALKISKILFDYGYDVFLNLMQINLISQNKLKKILKKITIKKKIIKCFYFADSFGCLTPNQTKKYCRIISKYWKNDFGIHTHNNLGLALKNTMAAVDNGATYVDSTILGMGRGSGNVATEEVLEKFIKKYNLDYSNKKILKLKRNYFSKLKNKYNWGKSIYYKLAAKKNIHPTFIQNIMLDNKFTRDQIIEIIKKLKKFQPSAYNSNVLKKSYLINNTNEKLSCLKNFFYRQNILLITNTVNAKKNINLIRFYKLKKKYKVISLNFNKFYDNKIIDFNISNNFSRILSERKLYKKETKLILPTQYSYLVKNLRGLKFYNFDVEIAENEFSFSSGKCKIPYNISIAYALSLLNFFKAKNIGFVGFDGYDKEDYLQYQMEDFLKIYKKKSKIKIKFLTETSYS
jgi:4-hydroxy 2-oxovalerate aldolase